MIVGCMVNRDDVKVIGEVDMRALMVLNLSIIWVF